MLGTKKTSFMGVNTPEKLKRRKSAMRTPMQTSSQGLAGLQETIPSQVAQAQGSVVSLIEGRKPPQMHMTPYCLKPVVALPKLRQTNVPVDKVNPTVSEYRLNQYYNGFMRDHFLVEGPTAEISSKLKSRLQNRSKYHSQTPAVESDPQRIDESQRSNRLAEMNTAQRALRTPALNLPKPVATAPISPKNNNAFILRAASETP